ncbi:MAG TPA: acyltransferase family protein [Pseudolabrys sp.]|nr:acyltransferase family protein [Pseudolabrys sp.]
MHDGRVDWVDYAKGFCIVFVVMMHSTLGLEEAAGREGWLHHLVAFALPFRMPDFFMIAGLFLGRIVDRPWRGYLDRKVLHFAYFYLLWMTIQFVFKAPGMAHEHGAAWVVHLYFLSLIEPLGILWFIYLLPIFFVVVKLTRRVPPPIVWLVGAALEIAHVNTAWTAPGEFANRFVYFYTGYLMAGPIFALTAKAQARPWLALGGLAVWALVNGTMVQLGYEKLPFISLGLGLIGACAVVTSAALMAKSDLFKPLRYCGRNSIVIYLAFFLPMAATRTFLLKTGVIGDIGTMSVIVTAAGIIGALLLFWAVRGTRFSFLFERPAMFRLTPPKFALQPAE